MQSQLKNVNDYVKSIPKERATTFQQLRTAILSSLPKGFEECMSYGMIGYVVPHSLYPQGYHCDPKLPLPFVSLASQKNFIAFYHMGMYADKKLLDWFVTEYPKHSKKKLDMGKSCVRFKYMDDIPFALIGEVMKKMSVKEWITIYENNIKL
jgi:Domain of unknown function (DU1801)